MSESPRRTISGHKKTIVFAATAIAAAIIMISYSIPAQQQFAMATVMGPGPIVDGDVQQEIEDVLARLNNLQEEVEDERAKAVLARLINVIEEELARLLPPPPPPPNEDVEYCYDYRTDTTTAVESVCYTNREACENDRVADPREVISTSCYERQQPEN